MKVLSAIAGILSLFISLSSTASPVIDLITGFEYTSTSGSALVAEIEADGLMIDGSAASFRSVTGFFGTPPSEGTRSLNVSIDVAEDIEGGSVGLIGTLNVSAGDTFAVDYIARRRESFGLASPHIDSYVLFAILFDGEGTPVSDPIILAEGTSVVENILEYRTASTTVSNDGILGFGFYIFHEEGVAVSGRTFVLNLDNVRVERAPAVVPVPASINFMATALLALLALSRRRCF